MTDTPSRGACLDCKRRYGDEYGFPDLMVSDEVWRAIVPAFEGGGLLCPSCICARAHAVGISGVTDRFTSGPFAVDVAPAAYVMASCEDCGWQATVPEVGWYWVCECPETGRTHRMKKPVTRKVA